MARYFALAALLIQFVSALNVNSSMSRTSKTKAFETLTTRFPQYRNRWISDDKWLEIIRNNYFAAPSKEKEKELCFNRRNMVKAVGSQWSQQKHERFHDDEPIWHISAQLLRPVHQSQ
jgi:hypothetical protein